jgi:prevent-host-death family protein
MKSLSASEFKATCLAVLEEVKRHKKRVVITKRGKPIAEIVPYDEASKKQPLKETLQFMGDIVSPVADEEWGALK